MIEERFGRRVANGLLLLVVAALAILALNIIITQGLAPTAGLVSEFMRGNDIRISWFGLVSFLISALLPGFSVWAGYRFFVPARQAAHNKKTEDATTQFETMAKE